MVLVFPAPRKPVTMVAGILPVVVMAPCSFTSSTPGGTLVQFVALVAPKISGPPAGSGFGNVTQSANFAAPSQRSNSENRRLMARRRAFLVDRGGALAFSKNKVITWSQKMDRETSLKTVVAVEEGTRMAAVVVAVLLGVFILMGSGFLQADVLHNAAHDARHAFAFPCH